MIKDVRHIRNDGEPVDHVKRRLDREMSWQPVRCLLENVAAERAVGYVHCIPRSLASQPGLVSLLVLAD